MCIISCALHRLEHFICEKSHVLHAPAWLLIVRCDLDLITQPGRAIEIYAYMMYIFFNSDLFDDPSA